MEDNKIIKALECCASTDIICEKCPCNDGNGNCSDAGEMFRGVLKLINRQKAEIEELYKSLDKYILENKAKEAETERLKNLEPFKTFILNKVHGAGTKYECDFRTAEAMNKAYEDVLNKLLDIVTLRVETIKEFERRIKAHAYYISFPKEHRVVDEEDIDNLVKELTE